MSITTKHGKYITVDETSTKVNRSKNTIYQSYKKWGWIPYRYGPNLMFSENQIQKWLDSQIVKA